MSVSFDPETDFDRAFTRAVGRRVRRFLRPGDRVLELGCATGVMTELLASAGNAVTALDRSPEFLRIARERELASASFVETVLEEFEPGHPFEQVVAAHVLNELDDPVGALARCRGWLAPGGLVHVSVMNPRSVHRLIALEMGLIDDLHARGAFGTPMIDGDSLEAMGRAAGLECLHREPVLLKAFTNGFLAGLPSQVIEGFERLARHFPDHGGVTYAIFAAP